MKKYTPYLIIVAIIAVVILLVMMFKPAKATTKATGSGGGSGSGSGGGTGSGGSFSSGCTANWSGKPNLTLDAMGWGNLDQSKVLKCGSYNQEVVWLQNMLGITEDGKFGPQTEEAVFKKWGRKDITMQLATTLHTVSMA